MNYAMHLNSSHKRLLKWAILDVPFLLNWSVGFYFFANVYRVVCGKELKWKYTRLFSQVLEKKILQYYMKQKAKAKRKNIINLPSLDLSQWAEPLLHPQSWNIMI
jgi:hypothetical protein